jgi:hypothetical protein
MLGCGDFFVPVADGGCQGGVDDPFHAGGNGGLVGYIGTIKTDAFVFRSRLDGYPDAPARMETDAVTTDGPSQGVLMRFDIDRHFFDLFLIFVQSRSSLFFSAEAASFSLFKCKKTARSSFILFFHGTR